MSKGSACFYCRNSCNAKPHPSTIGWWFNCSLGLDNTNLNGEIEDALKCPQVNPRYGFQIGGYYTHMWFEPDGDCLTWVIASNGQSPTKDEAEMIRFHICEFKQIEDFVRFWKERVK